MRNKTLFVVLISCLLMSFAISGCNIGQKKVVPLKANPNLYNETGLNKTAMDNILEKSCYGKSIGDTCSVQTVVGKMTSTCTNVNGRVLCKVRSLQRKI